MSNFKPELGQYAFGNRFFEYKCPQIVEDGLRRLAHKVGVDETYLSYFENDVFTIRSYDWGAACTCGYEGKEDVLDSIPHEPDCFHLKFVEKFVNIQLDDDIDAKMAEIIQLAKDSGLPHASNLNIRYLCTCSKDKIIKEFYANNQHADDCRLFLPNFLHKPSGTSVDFYKYVGRGMSANKKMASSKWKAIFQECIDSIKDVT